MIDPGRAAGHRLRHGRDTQPRGQHRHDADHRRVGGPPASQAVPLAGSVNIDGSSTVYPITEAVAEEFQKANTGVKVTVAFAGTGGGFKKFCAGETDMNDASRPIKKDDAGEGQACTAKSIDYLELGIATDALSVVVSRRTSSSPAYHRPAQDDVGPGQHHQVLEGHQPDLPR